MGKDNNGDGMIDFYEADVTSAQDYYPFGMLMPGRRGVLGTNGQWNGTGGSNGIPANLSISNRTGNTPAEYKATIDIEFVDEFISSEGDSFEAFITTANEGDGTSTGSGDVAGAYRYGMNGQEHDNELNENIYTALYWEYDSRIGRRWNVDPVPYESQSPYAVFDNNPIAITDVDGDCTDCQEDPVKSKYLGWTGLSFGSFGNGVADGFIGALPDLGGFVWDLIWSGDARDNFASGLKTVFNDPIGTIQALAAEKYELWNSVLTGNGTEEQKYAVGKEVGNLIFGALSGAALSKLTEVIKVAKAEKQLVKIVQKADEATGVGKATERGKDIHKAVEGIVSKKGKGEVAYVKGKKVDQYRPEGSSNPDVRYSKNPNKPKIVYDIKTGKSGMSKKQLSKYKENLPKGTKIKEVIKDDKGKYKVKTVGKAA